MNKYADLHIHTNASDGEYSPSCIVRAAKLQGFAAISITDHDTLEGLKEAVLTCQEVNLELISGVEISTVYNELEIHILGYLFDPENQELLAKLNEMKISRRKRIEKMVAKLQDLNYDMHFSEVADLSGSGAIGRPHIAKVLLEKGYVKSIKEAFIELLGSDCPAYIPRYKITPSEVIQLILNAQGIPILAHPGVNNVDSIIPFLKESGLLGLEVWHPEHNQQATEKYYNIAKANGLLMTGGSDYHGSLKDSSFSLGSIKIDYALVQMLKDRKKKLQL